MAFIFLPSFITLYLKFGFQPSSLRYIPGMYNRHPSQSHGTPANQSYYGTPSATSSSGQSVPAPHDWVDPTSPLGRGLLKKPSQSLRDTVTFLEPMLRPHGGRSAPVGLCPTMPGFKNTRAIPNHIAYADYESSQLSVGDFVVAQHYIREQAFSTAKFGQIIEMQRDPVHTTNVFIVCFVDQYTRKGTRDEYSIWNGDRLTTYQGDTSVLYDLHSNQADIAPNMHKAHTRASSALATPVVHGEIHSPKRRR